MGFNSGFKGLNYNGGPTESMESFIVQARIRKKGANEAFRQLRR